MPRASNGAILFHFGFDFLATSYCVHLYLHYCLPYCSPVIYYVSFANEGCLLMTMDRHNRVVWTGHCYWLATLRRTTAWPFCLRMAAAQLVPSRADMQRAMVMLLC